MNEAILSKEAGAKVKTAAKTAKNKKSGARGALEFTMKALFLICGLVAVGFVLIISVYLIVSGIPAIREVGLLEFLGGTDWDPANRSGDPSFGILPMIVGSLLLSVSALLLSWPLAVGVACAIQDGGKKRLFGCTIAGIVRFMTTIPTVVYGFAAVFLLVPVVREAAGKGSGLCWLSAALMLALLILPTMVLVMDSAMRTKERNVRITAAALGFTRSQTLACLVLPASRRWLLTAASGAPRAIR